MYTQGKQGVVVKGRVEIDTRQPFRSVREAVMLFGEKVLAAQVYANQLKEMQPKMEEVKIDVEETKEEADSLDSLRQELEQTKREILQLKNTQTLSHHADKSEIKFVEFQKKRSVKFASPLMLDCDQEKKKKKPLVTLFAGLFIKKKKKNKKDGEF